MESLNKYEELLSLLTLSIDTPDHIKYDVLKRASDWIGSGGDFNADYIQSQINYLERYNQQHK